MKKCKMKKLRIAFVHSASLYPLNGENIKGNCLLKLLVKNGHKVDFIAPYSKNIPKSVKVYPGPSTSTGKGECSFCCQPPRFVRPARPHVLSHP